MWKHKRGAGDVTCEAYTKARGVENRPSAKMRGTPKLLRSENHTKSQWNARNSSKVLYIIEKKQI